MTESDVLERAAKALRMAHGGQREGSGFTRARIMVSLHQKRRVRVLRWAVLSPLATLLLVGSAWAQSAGKWPVVWQAVSSVFVSVSSSAKPEVVRPGPGRPRPPAEKPIEEAPVSTPPVVEAPAEVAPEADAATHVAPAPAPQTELAPRRAPKRARSAAVEAPSSKVGPPSDDAASTPPTAAEAAADRELSQFRAAHDLHFRGDRPREAIAAYAAYLRAYPNGRFVPEARYNTALDHVKLGDDAAARAALEPFAAGRYGSYRRKEARQLLDAMR